ncbi:unnamed protein product [Coregonus sp. 'balchen']|nr:unnamed protein product [Coregonus sp. 'balchen']
MAWKAAGVFVFLLLIARSSSTSLPISMTVYLNDTVTLPFYGSCNGHVIEWKHRQKIALGEIRPTTLVAKLDQQPSVFTPGVGFENRVKRGDIALDLTITSVVFNDMGWFECHCGKTQEDVELVVLVPIVVGEPAHVGSNFKLNCYGLTEKQTPNSEVLFYWKRHEENVLSVKGHHLTYGLGFENRVSVSKDAYRQGDLSITLSDLSPSDQGTYHCFFGSKKRGTPDAVTLTVQEECWSTTSTWRSPKSLIMLEWLLENTISEVNEPTWKWRNA